MLFAAPESVGGRSVRAKSYPAGSASSRGGEVRRPSTGSTSRPVVAVNPRVAIWDHGAWSIMCDHDADRPSRKP